VNQKVLSVKDCYELLTLENVPLHIISHSEKVALITHLLTCFLVHSGEELSLELAVAGALLHDIKKFESITSGIDHGKAGYEMLLSLGYPRVAEIVLHHINLPEEMIASSRVHEDEVVFYSDKRVMHEDVVSVEERFVDLRVRYGKTQEKLRRLDYLEKVTLKIEEKIFSKLRFSPDVVNAVKRVPKEEVRNVLETRVKGCTTCWREFL